MGAGPGTGGGFGYCGPNARRRAFSGYGARGGFGMGRRLSRAYGCRFGWGRMSKKEEHAFLMDHIADLKANLAALEERKATLNKDVEAKVND
jgi:hypothetical protein